VVSGAPCPARLARSLAAAQERLRVISEMTGRMIAGDPSALLAAASAYREANWGVALDDVGADPAAAALIPLLQPDVIKLDISLIHEPNLPNTPHVVNTAVAYAEESGAAILAEGIETEEHLEVARAMGATLGQGMRLGPPQTELHHPQPPKAPVRLLESRSTTAPDSLADAAPTPFELVARRRPVRQTTRRMLLPMTRYLEEQALEAPERVVVLSSMQTRANLDPDTAVRYEQLASQAPIVGVFGAGFGDTPIPGLRGVSPLASDPLLREYVVSVLGPHFSGALGARELRDGGTGDQRRYEYVLTYQRELVVDVARSLLHRLPGGAPQD